MYEFTPRLPSTLATGIGMQTPEQAFLGYPAPTPSQIYQPVYEEDWCDKDGATPWCL
jgi:hypothetical protein